MKKLLQGESRDSGSTWNNDTSTVSVSCRHPSLSEGCAFGLTWTFDWAGVTRDQLLVIAQRSETISQQAIFGGLKTVEGVKVPRVPVDGIEVWDNKTFAMVDVLAARKPKVKRSLAMRESEYVDSLSDEDFTRLKAKVAAAEALREARTEAETAEDVEVNES